MDGSALSSRQAVSVAAVSQLPRCQLQILAPQQPEDLRLRLAGIRRRRSGAGPARFRAGTDSHQTIRRTIVRDG